MADNVDITAGSGTTIHADEYTHGTLGSGKTQLVKLVDGTLNSGTAITVDVGAKANALRIAPANDITDGTYIGDIKFGEGLPANDGVDIGDVDVTSVPAPLNLTGGGVEASALRVTIANDSTGVISIDDGGNVITVDGTVTANLSATDNAVLDNIQTAVELIDNAISGSEMQVDVVAALPIGDNNIGNVDIASSVALDVSAATVTVDSELTTDDLDTGAGSDTRAVVGLVGSASGGGELIPGSATNGLLVNLGSNNDVTLATLPDTAGGDLADIETNTDFGAVVGGGVEASALRVTIANDSTGVLSIDDGGNIITVDGTVTANLSATDNAVLDNIEADTTAIQTAVELLDNAVDGNYLNVNLNMAGTDAQAGEGLITASTQRVTIATDDDGVAHLATIAGDTTSVDGKITACNTGAVVLAASDGTDIGDVDVASVVPGTGATNLGKAIDSASGATDTGVAVLVIRDDALTTLSAIEGDYVPLRVNSTGALHVTGSAGSTQYVEDVAHGSGDTGTMALVVRSDAGGTLADTDGDYAPLQVNSSGALRVTGGGGGTEYNEDDATANPIVGTATLMERDDIITTLTPIEGDWAALRCSEEGALWVQDFNSDAILADTANMDTNLGTIAGAVTGSEMQVDIVAELPAGTQNIGDVDVATIAAGTNYIGKVRLTDGTNDSVLDASGYLQVDIAADSVGIGGGTQYAVDAGLGATPTGTLCIARRDDALGGLTPVEDDAVALRVDANGALWTHDDALDACIAGSELQVDVVTCDGIAAEDTALGNGILIQGDDGTDRHNVAVDTSGNLQVDLAADSSGGIEVVQVTAGDLNMTEANSAAILADTASMDTNLGTVAGAVAAGQMQVDVVAELPAGTQNIGDVDVATIAAGTNYIGRVRLTDGVEDSAINASGHLQVDIATDSVGIGGGTQYAVDAGLGATPTGTLCIARRDDALGGLTPVEDDAIALRVDANGALWTHDNALDAALSGSELQVDIVAELPAGTQNIGDVDVASIAAGTNYIGRVRLTDGTNDSVLDGSGLLQVDIAADSVGVGGGTQYAVDDGLGATPTGTLALARRDDALGGLTPVADDAVALRVDANGALWTHDDALDAALAGTELQVDIVAELPAGTQNIGDVDVLTVPAPLNVTGGGTEAAALRVTLANDSTGLVSIDDGGGDISVDWAGTAPPIGAGTEAAALRVTLATDSTGVVSVDDNGANLSVDWGGTVPPIGAGTEAAALRVTLATDSTGLVSVDDNGGSLTVDAAGDVAHDTADSGNPVKVGGKAKNMDGTAPGTAVAEDDRANFISDVYGRQFVEITHPNLWSASENNASAQTNNQLKAAPGAGLSLYITDVIISNGATAGNVKIVEDTAGTPVDIMEVMYFAANGGAAIHLRTPIKVTANKDVGYTSVTVTTHTVTMSGFIAP
jgi:hypothetical protein